MPDALPAKFYAADAAGSEAICMGLVGVRREGMNYCPRCGMPEHGSLGCHREPPTGGTVRIEMQGDQVLKIQALLAAKDARITELERFGV